MNDRESKIYHDILEKHFQVRRANQDPYKAMDDFEQYMKDLISEKNTADRDG